MNNQEEYLSVSGIQHFIFCRRQWALIHIEQQWQENYHTIDGELFHENAHNPYKNETRKDTIISRGMPVVSNELKISGVCDIVEFIKDKNGITLAGHTDKYVVCPIEYKRGGTKKDDCDILQLTAQCLCLEEMLCCKIEQAYIFYGKTRQKICVKITDVLKKQVTDIFSEMHILYDRKYTPIVKPGKKCSACSLKELCLPKICKNKSVSDYIDTSLQGETL